ncbi:MAG TPA: helix-turn-helix transcriptional regulator [Fimbriimonas sp.]|nr:helix-turn-helix transcriptional regulator [Fimbriimonas sp.]
MAFKGDLEALILAVLAEQELHGYEILKQIKQKSSDVLKFGEGQLYPALHKLESEGLVNAVWVPQEGKPDRKVYRLTPSGTTELDVQRNAWKAFSQGVGEIFGSPQQVKS